jgi:hypothetical protein
VGPGDFKTLPTKKKDTSTLMSWWAWWEYCAYDDCSNYDDLCVFEHDFQVDAWICWQYIIKDVIWLLFQNCCPPQWCCPTFQLRRRPGSARPGCLLPPTHNLPREAPEASWRVVNSSEVSSILLHCIIVTASEIQFSNFQLLWSFLVDFPVYSTDSS